MKLQLSALFRKMFCPSSWLLGILLLICPGSIGKEATVELTCATNEISGDDACDWKCKLQGRRGECTDECEESLCNKNCTCYGDQLLDLDLFDDDGVDSQGGTLPFFLKQIIFFRITQTYVFGSRERLQNPNEFGFENAENFYIPSGNGTLGAWYIPAIGSGKSILELNDNDTLVVYMHGNSRDRSLSYRTELYKMLTKLGLNVLAFDYRSYGDSSFVKLSETSVVDDGKAALAWVLDALEGMPNLVLWGHSLGTAVATRVAADSGANLTGLVLESPFNKMEDEVNHFSVAKWTARLMNLNITEVLVSSDVEFRTEDHLPLVEAPTIVLHAEDDKITPYYLGEKLVDTAKAMGKENVKMINFESELELGHRYIYRAPGIEDIVTNFVNGE